MGAAVGAALTARGETVQWLPSGRSEATRARASRAGLVVVDDLGSLTTSSDVVVSVVPPEAALATAREVVASGCPAVYLDANAIAPSTARVIAGLVTECGGTFVDGGIVGGPPRAPGETRLFVSGPRAAVIAGLFEGSSFDAVCLGDAIGSASAVKTAYAAYTKGGGALLTAVRAYARAEGVELELLAEWARSQPGLEARSESTARSHAPKAWRFEGELREIATAFDDAGVPGGFFAAGAELSNRLGAFKDADAPEPDEVFDAVRRDRPAEPT
ncbi:MAG: NAD(P)-dependent oxidoreductase [Actinobacteria bacterium]|nr:NAD(P)-dependent oxidoreductase [Actinomycetota bacterium]